MLAVIVKKVRRDYFILLGLLLIGSSLYGQAKQGYIDYDKVIIALPSYSTEQKVVETRKKELYDSIKVIFEELNSFIQTEIPHNTKIDSDTKARMERKLTEIQNRITQYREYAEKEINTAEKTADENLRSILTKELKDFSTTMNIICVTDKNSILYCPDCKNLTDEFLRYLKTR